MRDGLKIALRLLLLAAHGCGPAAPLEPPSAAAVMQAAPAVDAGRPPVEIATTPAPPPPPASSLVDLKPSLPAPCPDTAGQPSAAQAEAALLDVLAQLEARYELGGRWGSSSSSLQLSPADAAFSGTLAITRREGPVLRSPICLFGWTIPVRVALSTQDGALADELDGTARLEERHDATVDGSPLPFVLEVEASLDLSQRRGTLQIADSSLVRFKRAVLRATITPFGSRGELNAEADPGGPGDVRAAPAPQALLAWPAAADPSCGEDETLVPSQGGPFRAALREAMDRVAAQPMAAHYDDGTRTRLSVRVDPPRVACGTGRILLPTEARLATADGRLSARVAVKLDTSYARLFFNTRTDVPWAFKPAELGAHGITVQAPLSGFAQAGIEAEVGEGIGPSDVKLIGYGPGACLDCDAECKECSWERRVQVLGLVTEP